VPVADVRIDDALWEPASRLRRQEWRTLVTDLVDEATFLAAGPRVHLRVAARGLAAEVIAMTDSGEALLALEVAGERLGPFVDEYMAIVRRMTADDLHPSRLEALDMAKKVVHDKASRLLAEELAPLAGDHESFRRLFSLIVALFVDTTALPLTHRHVMR
jgi:uncharacterized protein (UPF0262 family)